MTWNDDEVAPQTKEHHFTDPVKTEETTYSIDRYTHHVPLNWFLVVSGEIDADDYEFYVDKQDLFDENVEDYAVQAVEFDYDRERNSDGTGKPFHVIYSGSEGVEQKCYSRTHYLLWLLDYNDDTDEVVAVTPTDERDGVLVTVQERLPHIPKE